MAPETARQLQDALATLTEDINGQDDSWPFREPVDTTVVTDYLAIIKHPMGALRCILCCAVFRWMDVHCVCESVDVTWRRLASHPGKGTRRVLPHVGGVHG